MRLYRISPCLILDMLLSIYSIDPYPANLINDIQKSLLGDIQLPCYFSFAIIPNEPNLQMYFSSG
jgi:hypothetical protein